MNTMSHPGLPFKPRETPVISIQSDWNETLRENKGEAWVSCKFRGKPSSHGKIVSEGLSNGEPLITATDGFEVKSISRNSIQVRHLPSDSCCLFIASEQQYSGIHSKSVLSVDVTQNGLCVSSCMDDKMYIWDVTSGMVRRNLDGHVGSVYKCRFFPSGIVVLSGGADMQIKIWSAETGQCPVTLNGHTAAITDFAIVERGRNIISVSKDGSAKLWDCGMSSCLGVLVKCNSCINSCCLTRAPNKIGIEEPDEIPSDREVGTKNKLLIVGCEDSSVHVVAIWSRKILASTVLTAAVNCVTMLTDDYVLVGCQDGQVLLYNIEEMTVPVQCWFESNSAVLCILPYEQKGYFVGKADGSCTYYHISESTESHENIRVQLTGPDCDPVYDISCDGTYIYTACRDTIVRRYNVKYVIYPFV